jgi:hypothetical protein
MDTALDFERPERLLVYLRDARRIGAEETPIIRTLTGSVSNRVVLVERPSGEVLVLKQAMAKLRVAVDWFSPPERVQQGALGMRWLIKLAPVGNDYAHGF